MDNDGDNWIGDVGGNKGKATQDRSNRKRK